MQKAFLVLLLNITSFLLQSQSFVHVRDEPRHHNVFENEFIRILDVHLGPKDTTLYHLHNTPSVFVVLTNSNVGSRLMGGQPQSGANLSGTITYDPISTPRTHQVWNEDTNWFHVMDIELTSSKSGKNENVLQIPSLEKLFSEQKANGYKIKLEGGKSVQLPKPANGYLLVSLGPAATDLIIDQRTEHRKMKAGHYQWIEAGKKFSIENKGATAEFILLQLK